MKKLIKYIFLLLTIYICLGETTITLKAEIVDSIPEQNQWFLNDIDAQKGWDYLITQKKDFSNETIVAVIDTGTDYTHPLIASSLWTNQAELNGIEGYDDDNNGYVDDIHGINTYDNTSVLMDDSTSPIEGHGTHVAGSVLEAAGVTTASNPFNIRLMIIKAGDKYGNFTFASIEKAIRYAVDNGASVINMSLSTQKFPSSLSDTLDYASQSAIIIASAGNKGVPTTDSEYTDRGDYYPAGYRYVVGTMSHNSRQVLSSFSNWDFTQYSGVDYNISAPGENIYSCYYDGKFKSMNGTSMSSGILSGCAALLCAQQRNSSIYSFRDLASHISTSANQNIIYTDVYGKAHTFKKINLYRLLSSEITPQVVANNFNIKLNDSTDKSITLDYSINCTGCTARDISAEISCDSYSFTKTYIQNVPEVSGALDIHNIKLNLDFDQTLPQNDTVNLKIHLSYKNGCDTNDVNVYTKDYSVPFKTGNNTGEIIDVPLQGITISTASSLLKCSNALKLNVSYLPDNTTADRSITFSSSNPNIATIDENGVITGISPGSSVITAVSSAGHERTFTITVYQPDLIDINTISFKLTSNTYKYDGKIHKPDVASNDLTALSDYTIKYSNKSSYKAGTYKVYVYGKGKYTGKITLNYYINLVQGSTFTISNIKYKITSKTSHSVRTAGTAAVICSTNKNASRIALPNTVRIGGKLFKVTAISSYAFKNHPKLKKVTIGKYVRYIGKSSLNKRLLS